MVGSPRNKTCDAYTPPAHHHLARSQPSGQEEEAVGMLRTALQNPHGTTSEKRDRISRAWSSLRSAAAASASSSSARPQKIEERRNRRPAKKSKPATANGQDEKVQLLLESSQTGDFRKVKELLEDGVKVTEQDSMGYTALHWASLYGHAQVVRVLLNSGAGDGKRINRKTKSGSTALHFACSGQHPDVASMLHQYKPDVYAVNDYGQTPISLGLRKLLDQVEAAERMNKVQSTREQVPLLYLRSTCLEMGMDAHTTNESEAGPDHPFASGSWQGRIASLWEAYQKAWSIFTEKYGYVAASDNESPSTTMLQSESFRLADMPCPFGKRSGIDGDKDELLLAHLRGSGTSIRAFIQQERLRWHPDKFAQMFGRNIAPNERDAIMRRVQNVCQIINQIARDTSASNERN